MTPKWASLCVKWFAQRFPFEILHHKFDVKYAALGNHWSLPFWFCVIQCIWAGSILPARQTKKWKFTPMPRHIFAVCCFASFACWLIDLDWLLMQTNINFWENFYHFNFHSELRMKDDLLCMLKCTKLMINIQKLCVINYELRKCICPNGFRI